LETTSFGNTGLTVSRLGFGLAEMGGLDADGGREQAAALLNEALDSGINFLDTSACYGNSEELIGASVAGRRDEYVLATKAGHVAGGATGQAWTAPVISASIDRSLRRLKTDLLDLVQLHSCDKTVLQKGEAIQALQDARDAGKVRFIGYSGDNEDAVWAVESGIFDALQTSLNIVDQFARTGLLGAAAKKGMGVIIKRPIGNGAWRYTGHSSTAPDDYAKRASEMASDGPAPGEPDDPILTALGFVMSQEHVDTAIVGTTSREHLRSNIRMVEGQIPIPRETVEELQRRFDRLNKGWGGMM